MTSQDPASGTTGPEVVAEREKAVGDLSWYRPLHSATAYGHREAAEFLISAGASISQADENGWWPIELAIERRVENLIPLLLHHHEKVFLDLIHRLIGKGNLAHIKRLVELRPELLSNGLNLITALGNHCGSMLHLAAADGQFSVYKLLAQMVTEHDAVDSKGRQPIHYASACGHASFVNSILADERTASVVMDEAGRNALFYAVLGANCCENPYWSASDKRGTEVINSLLKNVDPATSTILVKSAIRSLAESPIQCTPSQWFDESEDDDSIPDKDGLTSLNFENRLWYLISLAPDLTMDGEFLHAAFLSTFFPLKRALKLVGDINDTTSTGQTALHAAAAAASQREWNVWHRKLVGDFANVDHRDLNGRTALHLAVQSASICGVHSAAVRIETLLKTWR